MSKTVLELVQAACYEIGHPAPTAMAASTDSAVLQLKHLLYAECRALRNQRVFPQQKKTYSISITSGRYRYQLPKDYYSALMGTQINTDTEDLLIGPVSDEDMAYYLYGPGGSTTEYIYRIFGSDSNPSSDESGQFHIHPIPSASGLPLYMEYVSSNLFKPKDWAASTSYTSGTDYVNVNGYNYRCITTGTSAASNPTSSTASDITDGTAHWAYYDSPYETILADSDLCIFDDDLVIAGLKWRIKQAKGLEYEDLNAGYARMLNMAKSRWTGPYVGSFTGKGARPRYRVPYGSWDI